MPTLKFEELDASHKQLVFQLAFEARTPTRFITDTATHTGELWEAQAFLMDHPKGTTEHEQLASRLRLGDASSESILDAIRRIAPDYVMLGERSNAELDELLGYAKLVFVVQ